MSLRITLGHTDGLRVELELPNTPYSPDILDDLVQRARDALEGAYRDQLHIEHEHGNTE